MSLPVNPEGLSIDKLYDVNDWVAVVTGGGTGLGWITAVALATNGARVYITGRRLHILEEAITKFGKNHKGTIIPVQCDVTSKDDIQNLVKVVSSQEKHLDLLVNNAGIGGVKNNFADSPIITPESVANSLFHGSDPETWHDLMMINTAAIYFVTAAFIPLLVNAKTKAEGSVPGSVINVSSMSGITKQSQGGQFAYNAAKAATISLTEQLAYEFRRPELSIRVNSIAPGYFPSEMTPAYLFTGSPDEIRKKWGIPMGRHGSATDYAQAVLHFAMNRYITGDTLIIDGGWLLEQGDEGCFCQPEMPSVIEVLSEARQVTRFDRCAAAHLF